MDPEDILDDPEPGNTCHPTAIKNDLLIAYILMALNLVPLVIGLAGFYLARSRTFDPIRIFCFSMTAYMGLVNVWLFPGVACPGVLPSDMTSSIRGVVQFGYIIIPIGFLLSGWEFAWYCMNNRILRSTRLRDDVGDNMDQSYGFETVNRYVSDDEMGSPLKVIVRYTGKYHGKQRNGTLGDIRDGAGAREAPLCTDSDYFMYDRIEDDSDQTQLSGLFPLKSWQGVQIKFSQKVLPGDQMTLNQMGVWKVEYEKTFKNYIAENFGQGAVNLKSTFEEKLEIVDFSETVMIYDASAKPWYFTPMCWFILACGAVCLLWIPVSLGIWRIKKVDVAVKKLFFIDSEKYKYSGSG